MGKLVDVSRVVSKFCIEENISVHRATELVYSLMNGVIGYDIEFEYCDPPKTIEREYEKIFHDFTKAAQHALNADVATSGAESTTISKRERKC